MIDVFMLIMTIILAVLLVIVSLWLLIYYGHPDDRWDCFAIFCKIVMIAGMTLAWAQVLMLPLDVSNARGFGGDINMAIFWQIIYISLAVFIVIIIPACTYYYEADDEWSCWEKFKYAFCYLLATIIVWILILVISYAFLSKAQVPVRAIYCSLADIQNSNSTNFTMNSCSSQDTSFEIDVSFPIYTIGLLSFISWFLFVIFGGIGLAALPLDFIYDFNTRPIKMSAKELADKKRFLIIETKRIKELADVAKSLEEKGALKKTFFSSEKREYNATMRKLRASVCILDNEYQMIEIQQELNDEWVLKYWIGLFIGIICLLLSLAWFIHIILYFIAIPNGQPIYPFLNNLLIYLTENNVSFLATAFFAMFCLYLLLAAIKGNVKFGLRILLCWSVHPMKRNETYINSFLFNVSLILLCSVSVTQFCAAAFKDYAVMTDVDLIFSTQIKYLKFFRYFFQYHIFEYSLFGFIILSTIYLLCRPSDKMSLESLVLFFIIHLAEKKRRGDELEESRGFTDRK